MFCYVLRLTHRLPIKILYYMQKTKIPFVHYSKHTYNNDILYLKYYSAFSMETITADINAYNKTVLLLNT